MVLADSSVRDACITTAHDFVALFDETRAAAKRVRELVSSMCAEMSPRRLSDGPVNRGHINPDGSPLELSLRLGKGKPDVRWALWDLTAQRGDRQASMALLRRMAQEPGARVEHAMSILGALSPESDGLAILGGAASGGASLPMQAYFIADRAFALEFAATHGPPGFSARLAATVGDDFLGGIATDLVAESSARAKVYVYLQDFALDRLGRYSDLAGAHWPLPALEAMTELYGEVPVAVSGHCGPHVCFHLRNQELLAVTLYLPCFPSWFDLPSGAILTDDQLSERVCSMLARRDIPSADYEAAIRHLAQGDIEGELWIHRFLSFVKDAQGRLSMTAYLSPRFYYEAFGVG